MTGINLEKLFPQDWKALFENDLNNCKDIFSPIQNFLNSQNNKVIYPNPENIFNAFEVTSLDNVKVVILGQDPYHQEGQAHGLSFSVPKGVKVPPSLKNIYKELERSTDFKIPEHGDLTKWAQQGVLLLNTVLTVEHSKAGSHQKKGWEDFTDLIIKKLSESKENLVFVLWGKPAQTKEKLIDQEKHLVLKSVHPSPLSAYRGFLGCDHFVAINEYLEGLGIDIINWQV